MIVACQACGKSIVVPAGGLVAGVVCPTCGHVQPDDAIQATPAATPAEDVLDVVPAPDAFSARPLRKKPRPAFTPFKKRWRRRDDLLGCPWCDEDVGVHDDECAWCGEPLDTQTLIADRDQLKAERNRFNILSLALGGCALLIFWTGVGLDDHVKEMGEWEQQLLMIITFLVATPFWVVAVACFARSRGHSLAYGFLGLLCVPGLLLLLMLPDHLGARILRLRLLLEDRGIR